MVGLELNPRLERDRRHELSTGGDVDRRRTPVGLYLGNRFTEVLDDSLEIRLHLEVRHGEVRVLTAVFDDNTLHHGRDIIELVTDPRILQHVQFVGEESLFTGRDERVDDRL